MKHGKYFTRDDAVVLILAILTHDLGMLLNIDGFRNLVNSNGSVRRLLVEDEPWHKIWHEYQLDARRFDGPSLTNLLGSRSQYLLGKWTLTALASAD